MEGHLFEVDCIDNLSVTCSSIYEFHLSENSSELLMIDEKIKIGGAQVDPLKHKNSVRLHLTDALTLIIWIDQQ